MKKWLPAIFILAAALIFFGVISLPHTGLPHSRAEALQWDEGHRQMTAEESEALDERLAGVKFNIRASGSTTLYMDHITVFFDDRKAQTILYCMEDGTLWLTVVESTGMRAGMPRCMTCCGRWRRRAEKKEKREPLFRGLPFAVPAARRGGGQSLVFCSMRCSSSVWRSISLWISLSVSRILFRIEFFHDGGASLYFHYDIINPQPEQRLLRRRLYPGFSR